MGSLTTLKLNFVAVSTPLKLGSHSRSVLALVSSHAHVLDHATRTDLRKVHIDSHHALATIVAFISTSSNPTSFDDFNTTSNGTAIPLASSIFQVPQGEKCFNIDLQSLNVGLTNGSEVTLQIQYDGVSYRSVISINQN